MDEHKVDEIIAQHSAERGPLISILHDIQRETGHLPDTTLTYLSDKLHMPLSEIYRVVSYFEKAFSQKPRADHIVKVCEGTSCHLKRSDELLTEIKEELEKEGEDPRFSLEKARCLGCCTAAPAVEIDGEIFDKDSAKSTITKLKGETKP